MKVEDAVVARHKGFEILVDCDKALEIKKKKLADVSEALAFQEVFKDSARGMRASEQDLENTFGTLDKSEICRIIIHNGEIQLNTSHRKKIREEKTRSLIRMIHELGVDPRTGHTHPEARIEAALEEAKVHIDEHKSPEEQLDSVVKKLRSVLPISFEKKKLAIRIPAEFAAKCYSILKQLGMAREEWKNDGSLFTTIEIAAARAEDAYSKIGAATHGNAEIKEIK